MQRSEELPEAANNLFLQVQALGIPAWSAGYCIWDEDKQGITLWMSSEGVMQPSAHAPCTEDPSFIHMKEAFERGEAFHVEEVGGEALITHYQYMRTLPVVGEILDSIITAGHPLPTYQIFHCVYFSQGFLLFITYEPVPEVHEVFKRFGNVFDQTYTRFLDLQNAEAQAREAQIQLALERVRARTMAMQHSDELKQAAALLFQQVKTLGAPAYSCGYNIWESGEKEFTSWMSTQDGSIINGVPNIPLTEDANFIRYVESKQKGEPFFVLELRGERMQEHYTYLKTIPAFKAYFDYAESVGFDLPETQIHHIANFSNGNLLFITLEPCPEFHDVFKRFAAVFEQTYTRFLDLQKAEAQAREAQIETALERVRSSSLAMHRSDELQGVVNTVIEQLKELNIELDTTNILIFNNESKKIEFWTGSNSTGKQLTSSWQVACTDYIVLKEMQDAQQTGQEVFLRYLSFEEKNSFFNYLFTNTDFKNLNEERKKFVFESKRASILAALVKEIAIQIVSYSREFFLQGEIEILKRFAKVFEQAYTRFLDLQKAEAQAQEAQIEAALERVRSRTMGMQKSEELKEVIQVVYEQLVHLHIPVEHTGFVMDYKTRDDHYIWIADHNGAPSQVIIPYFDCIYYNRFKEAKEKGEDFFVTHLGFEEKNRFYQQLFEYVPGLPEEARKFYFSCPGLAASTVLLENIGLYIENFSGIPFTDEDNNILMRFGKVFQQTYTRFLDLQKAEAQARESQIELGLERVRARAMAMQKSDELKELISTVFIELTKLDLVLTRCLIMIYDTGTNASTWWMANSEAPADPIGLYVKYHQLPPYAAYISGWKERKNKWEYTLEGKDKDDWDDFLFGETELAQLPDFVKEGMKTPDRVYLSASFNNFGCLNLATLEPLPGEHFDILLRFAKVFDLTYTRFNDLQKAEAQAREGQIELGLERVRARAMAMQTSGELSELVDTVFKELTKLDFALTWCIINIIDESSMSNTVWAANPDINKPPESYHLLFEDYPFHHAMMKGWKEKKTKYVYIVEGDEKKIYDDYLFSKTEFRRTPAAAQAASRAMEKYVVSFSFSNFGGLQTVGDVPLSDANLDILSRFGKVFDLTYTRFNDLKKAEAQAREAQIELSLERVRARAMAMHKSEELVSASDIVFQEMKTLGIESLRAGIGIMDPVNETVEIWSRSELSDNSSENTILGKVPAMKHSFWEGYYKGWKQKKDFFTYEFVGDDVREFYEFNADFLSYPKRKGFNPREVASGFYFPEGALNVVSSQPLTADQSNVMVRFAKVFGLTYKRFLDLQKAELQAREAQVELGLERVRARTMAMQHSDELQDAATVLFDQMKALGIQTGSCGFNIWDKEQKTATVWMSSPEGGLQTPFTLPHTESEIYKQVYEAMKKGEDFLVKEVGGKNLKKHFDYLLTQPVIGAVIKKLRETGYLFPERIVYHFAFFTQGYLSFHLHEHHTETHEMFKRFAKVFEQTYIRFLDLQKAEAQAREAQIETTLERIRSRTMAMQKSDELAEAATLVFQQFSSLGLLPESSRVFFSLIDEDTMDSEVWTTKEDGILRPGSHRISLKANKHLTDVYEAWKAKSSIYNRELTGDGLTDYLKYIASVPYLKDDKTLQQLVVTPPDHLVFTEAFFAQGTIGVVGIVPLTPESQNTLMRFSKVFEQTYTRFLDLQKAEAQARESRVQLALERVRARTMAMQKSEELSDASLMLFQQIKELGEPADQITIGIVNEAENVVEVTATIKGVSLKTHRHALDEPFIMAPLYKAWKEQKKTMMLEQSWEELQEYNKYRNSTMGEQRFAEKLEPGHGRVLYTANFSKGMLALSTPERRPEESLQILARFAAVFDQTYTRFLDLKKAEAQAREAHIEAGLERVRYSAMAMQSSEDVGKATAVVFNEISLLGVEAMRCGITIIHPDKTADVWAATTTSEGKEMKGMGSINFGDHPLWNGLFDAWNNKEENFFYALKGDDLKSYYNALKNAANYDSSYIKDQEFPDHFFYACFFEQGALFTFSLVPYEEEKRKVLKRFTAVFSLTFRRYLDLQKAEAQAREAKIEAALEKVRSRTMAMQKSTELSATATLLFEQLNLLGDLPERTFIGVFNEAEHVVEIWATLHGGFLMDRSVKLSLDERTVINPTYKAWKAHKKSVSIDLQGQDLEDYFQHLHGLGLPVSREIFGTRRLENIAFFSKGLLGIITNEPRPRATIELYERFAAVFDGTYTRFLDLQRSEAQVREAQIELALERVRARAMAMHKSSELADAAQLLYTEFSSLGMNSFSCGYMFIDEVRQTQTAWVVLPDGSMIPNFISFPLTGDVVLNTRYKDWKEKKPLHIYDIQGEDNKAHHQFLSGYVPAFVVDEIFSKIPDRIIFNCANFSDGYLLILATEHFSLSEQQTIVRFAKVFEQTFTRFLDLQKAEVQAKEANIETALERVRSKTMAMHNSQDVAVTVATMFDEFVKLGIDKSIRCGIGILDDSSHMELWTASSGNDGKVTLNIGKLGFSIHPLLIGVQQAWKSKSPGFTYELVGQDLVDYYTAISNYPDYHFHVDLNTLPEKIFHTDFFFADGALFAFTQEPITPEIAAILKRFAAVFGQTYRRFLDLQKAEAQAREATIEGALERVRSKTMAMHNSHDVGETVATLFDQLVQLGIKTNRCGILIFSNTNNTEVWTAKSNPDGDAALIIGHLDVMIHPLLKAAHRAWKNKETFFAYEMAGDDIKEYYNAINNHPDYPTRFNLDNLPAKEIHSDFFFPEGAVFSFTYEPIPAEAAQIFKRFAAVFGQTYRRYLDLQKAEAQAKEAQIETALEKVRSRTMAMQRSDELSETAAVLFQEFKKLGEQDLLQITIGIYNEAEGLIEFRVTSWAGGGELENRSFNLEIEEPTLLKPIFSAWKAGEKSSVVDLTGKELEDWINYRNKMTGVTIRPEDTAGRRVIQAAFFSKGHISISTPTPLPRETVKILERFAGVFDGTYTRFLDLQKAEGQAREALIEASLERVRGKAMSMHSSKDLSETVDVFFKELKTLGIIPLRCGVGELDAAERTSTMSATTAQQQGDSYEMIGKLKLSGHPVLDDIFEHWRSQTDYFPVLRGLDIKRYYQVLSPQVQFPDYPDSVAQYGNYFSFKEGIVFAWTEKELSEEELRIFRKFTSVISLTYRRYIELQKSEANARETVKQAALDRVRAEIASMRTIADLERITPVIWKELTILGIPFTRCGVFIMDEEQQLIHTFLSTPDGKAIGAFHLPYTTQGNIRLVLSNWQNKRNYIDHWDESAFTEFAEILMKQGTITSPDQYLAGIPEGGFHLHFLPFLQGMLYVGNTVQLGEEEIKLIQSVADAFSTAYARYEDFNRLEAAKQQVDKTLVDLKQAQQQLVQSEKMASLGELTAGIAHEIQNPLNFVNNFSEVSNELIDEMMEEVAKGNYEEVKAIADDVKQNLEKINHHGKRADGIVKGMLQHSRSSSATKEPTDINKLADEYLRLAYHGLRAKDKTFNAIMKTEYDENIGKISLIPQDIGRVVLNLITNAFYVVTEKKNQQSNGYEPTVTVSTKKDGDKVLVSVKDNGNGIPQKVLDKIFQPFFTTKPTGQGTGLGLSLSYDIVKAHGGELKVETAEGEGSEFTIQLPAN